jgi:uncharacterized membrane protein YiaA
MPIESPVTQAQSYRYLRLAMIGLLLALAAAVFYQSFQQDSILSSVSAYYYTPAQAIFVGALLGLGAIMIAMQGMNDAENMFLNLGGMFAIVVAIVPTARGGDFTSVVRACRQSGGTLLTHQASTNSNCPTVLALVEATRDNVQNNMVALLSVGFVALAMAGFLLVRNWTAKREDEGRRWVIAGFFAACLVWLCGLVALAASVDWLADNGHYIAGGGLLVSILVLAGSNTYRRRKSREKTSAVQAVKPALRGLSGVMVAISIVFIGLWQTNRISLFLLEMVVAFLFALFWTVQTLELENEAKRELMAAATRRGTADSLSG